VLSQTLQLNFKNKGMSGRGRGGLEDMVKVGYRERGEWK